MAVSARKAKVLLWTSMKMTGTHLLTSFLVFSAAPLLLLHQHSSPGQGVITFHNYCYSCNSSSRLSLFYIPEMSCCFRCFFLRYNYSRNIVVQDQEVWKTDRVRQHFEEWCTWYIYALFMRVNFRDQKKWMAQENDAYGENWYRFHCNWSL